MVERWKENKELLLGWKGRKGEERRKWWVSGGRERGMGREDREIKREYDLGRNQRKKTWIRRESGMGEGREE